MFLCFLPCICVTLRSVLDRISAVWGYNYHYLPTAALAGSPVDRVIARVETYVRKRIPLMLREGVGSPSTVRLTTQVSVVGSVIPSEAEWDTPHGVYLWSPRMLRNFFPQPGYDTNAGYLRPYTT